MEYSRTVNGRMAHTDFLHSYDNDNELSSGNAYRFTDNQKELIIAIK